MSGLSKSNGGGITYSNLSKITSTMSNNSKNSASFTNFSKSSTETLTWASIVKTWATETGTWANPSGIITWSNLSKN